MSAARRPLSHLGGPTDLRGAGPEAELLGKAWAAAQSAPADTLTHGFHSWPARMPWALARYLLKKLPATSVTDPFCGGGTVAVEARVAGIRCVGADLNPLSRLVTAAKTAVRSRAEREAFVRLVRQVAAESEARVRARRPVRVDLPAAETRWFDAHILKELGGLREEIARVPAAGDRDVLRTVFSAILVKVSRQRSDTAERLALRRLRKGLPTELFAQKALELTERWALLEARAKGPAPRLVEADVRELGGTIAPADLVLTSPPYGGTYDYAQHHARRLAWLSLDARRLRQGEIGARRHATQKGAAGRWRQELSAALAAMASLLRTGGSLVLVQGDAELGKRRVDEVDQLSRLAPGAGLRWVASASQTRPDFRGGRPRREHLIWLTRA